MGHFCGPSKVYGFHQKFAFYYADMKGEIMKRTLIASAAFASMLVATSAFAADLPVYTKAPAVAVVYDWTGYYIGTNVGYSFGRGTTDGTVTGTQTTRRRRTDRCPRSH